MPEHDHLPVIRRKLQQRRLDRVAQQTSGALLFGAGLPGLKRFVQGLEPPVLVQVIQRFVDRDPVHPAEESVLPVEGTEVLVRLQKDGLRDIPRVFPVPYHPERNVEQHPLVAVDQLPECPPITIQAPYQ